MWSSDQFDHSLIQVSVGELDGVAEGDAEGLLACGTSCVTENYERKGEMAFFKCEIFAREGGPGFRVEKTVVVTEGDWDGEVIWSQKEEFFLTSSFEPAMAGLILDELSRRTVNEYGRRIHAHENGVAYESRA
ncbi:hypothetical protein [Pseudomonas sp. NPDC087029]|uniref:hypothetical protein n=1 Tax=Pseudomonas sp. NPDC087029 TaxID=3364433 RepID=UPI0037FD0F5E